MAERHSALQDTGPKTVQVFDRAVAILDTFSPERPELGVSEIARLTGLSRGTVHRLLTTLKQHELVRQMPNSRNYALGPHLLRLAQIAFAHVDLRNMARQVMTALQDECGETVGLHTRLSPFTRTVLDQVESAQPLRRTYTEIGIPIPIYQGAPGKVLLGYSAPELQEEILAGKLEGTTPRSITDPTRLRSELDRTRRRGYALSLEERVPDTSTVAVPIANHTGQVIGALSITGPSSRLTRKRLVELAGPAAHAAEKISADLGYIGPPLAAHD